MVMDQKPLGGGSGRRSQHERRRSQEQDSREMLLIPTAVNNFDDFAEDEDVAYGGSFSFVTPFMGQQQQEYGSQPPHPPGEHRFESWLDIRFSNYHSQKQ